MIDALVPVFAGVAGIVLMLMPGYVFCYVLDGGTRETPQASNAFIASTAVVGVFLHAVFALPTWFAFDFAVQGTDDDGRPSVVGIAVISGWTLLVLVAVPAILAALLIRFQHSPQLAALLRFFSISSTDRTLEAWTWKFKSISATRENTFVRVRLHDGRSYLGWFGARSFASTRLADLYLEATYASGDNQPNELAGFGIWLSAGAISTMEFLDAPASGGASVTDKPKIESVPIQEGFTGGPKPPPSQAPKLPPPSAPKDTK